jgi:hypothetical protein
MPRLAIRPLVFRTIILLVVVNAAAGIAVIVAGSGSQIGDTESKVLLTTGLLSLTALLLLPCVLAHEAGRPKPLTLLPSFAVSCLLIGASLGVYLVWSDLTDDLPNKIAWSFGVAGGGLAHVCLVSLVRMRRSFVWLQLLAVLFTAALTAMILSAFWTDFADEDIDDWKWRAFIITAILAAATSLLVPVVALLLRSRPHGAGTPRRASYCPNCAAVLHMEEPRCLACGARFRVEFMDA